eukprot:scaffold174205_cov20-Tisochrysis_lutea.AAC.4
MKLKEVYVRTQESGRGLTKDEKTIEHISTGMLFKQEMMRRPAYACLSSAGGSCCLDTHADPSVHKHRSKKYVCLPYAWTVGKKALHQI